VVTGVCEAAGLSSCYPCTSTYFDPGIGYRNDELHWRTKHGDFHDEWENINIAQAMCAAQIVSWEHLTLKFGLDWGWVCGGTNRSKAYYPGSGCPGSCSGSGSRSYSGSGSRSYSSSGSFMHKADNTGVEGHVWDGTFGLGYLFSAGSCLEVTPFVGYSYHQQKFHINGDEKRGRRSRGYSGSGRFDEFRNQYNAQWQGPWLGLNVSSQLSDCLRVYADGEFHWACFDAWGKRSVKNCCHSGSTSWSFSSGSSSSGSGGSGSSVSGDSSSYSSRSYGRKNRFLKSITKFHQDSDGSGVVGNLGISYTTAPNWAISLLGNFQTWYTSGGKERRKTLNEHSRHHHRRLTNTADRTTSSSHKSEHFCSSQKLQQIHWRSVALTIVLETFF
jgi:hypothetical protein